MFTYAMSQVNRDMSHFAPEKRQKGRNVETLPMIHITYESPDLGETVDVDEPVRNLSFEAIREIALAYHHLGIRVFTIEYRKSDKSYKMVEGRADGSIWYPMLKA